MLAVIMALSWFEHTLPPLPLLPPGVKLGLSNIVTMYCVFFVGWREALALAFLKSCFIFIIRGLTAGALSLCGGIVSVLVIIILSAIFKDKISYLVISIFGAIAHNLGQLSVVPLFLGQTFSVVYYTPILIVSGIIMGSLTGALLKAVMPLFKNVFKP